MNRAYVPFHVVASHLPAALRAITALGLLGVNVTVPHKERVARLLKRQSAEARALGAVNCVFPQAGELFGDNTDARGLAADLAALSAPIKERTVILIGAGGGAAAALLALRRLGAKRVVLANRTRSRAIKLAARFRKLKIEVRDLGALRHPELVGEAGLVINATSVGLKSEAFPTGSLRISGLRLLLLRSYLCVRANRISPASAGTRTSHRRRRRDAVAPRRAGVRIVQPRQSAVRSHARRPIRASRTAGELRNQHRRIQHQVEGDGF